MIYENFDEINKFIYKKFGGSSSNILDRIAYHHFYLIYNEQIGDDFKIDIINNDKYEKEFSLNFGGKIYYFHYNFNWLKNKVHNIKSKANEDALQKMLSIVLREKTDWQANKNRTLLQLGGSKT